MSPGKLAHVTSREPVCKTCNHDPVNRVVEELRAEHAGHALEGELQAVLDDIIESDGVAREFVAKVGATMPASAPGNGRKLIPLRQI